jgi:hypothetical protein
VAGHCNAHFMWCWDWHYDAGAVSIMSYIKTCNDNIYRPDNNKQCNRALRYGAATVTVTDIPKTGDLWGDIYHHSHDQFMGDASNDPARALRETGPMVTNYIRHGCKWWDGLGFTNGEGLGSVSLSLNKTACDSACQSDGMTLPVGIRNQLPFNNTTCTGVSWDSRNSQCSFFRNLNLRFLAGAAEVSVKRRC